jgi:hypothetical protein
MGAFGKASELKYNEDFITCFRFCNDDAVGIGTYDPLGALKLYPNPAVNGKSTISGLEGNNTIVIYNVLGQVISSVTANSEMVEIDLSKEPKGTYVVRISNSNNQSKTIKVVNQN